MKKRGFIKRASTVWQLLREAKPQDFTPYIEHFNEISFQEKLERIGHLLGDNILLPLLRIYYILRSHDTPTTAKLYIMGALGYFIFPMDLIPDFLPSLFGFSDDLIVIGIILRQVEKYSTPEVELLARERYHKICPKKML